MLNHTPCPPGQGVILKQNTMKKAYMLLKYTDEKASNPHIGIEYMGNCGGVIVDEDGNELGQHHSSSFGWLRRDLSSKVDDAEYEVIDLIGREVPEKFKHLTPS